MNRETPVRAAIVGLGRWGRNLVRSVASDPNSPLQFVRGMTRTPENAVEFGNEQGFDVTGDLHALLMDAEIEAIVLATPHSQHCQQICSAANAGKHVFVEKPLALTSDEAKRAISACKENHVELAVGFNRRFLGAYQDLCTQYHAGKLGVPLHMECNFSGPFGYDYKDGMWRGSADENPAGGMAAMGIHMLDAMIHLLGPVHRVTALSRRRALTAEIDDTTTIQMEFENGATGCLTSLMATPSNWRLHLFGSAGWAAMPDQETLEVRYLDDAPITARYDPTDTLAEELRAFAKTIRQQVAFPVTKREAIAGVAAMQAITQSVSNDGKTVKVENQSAYTEPESSDNSAHG